MGVLTNLNIVSLLSTNCLWLKLILNVNLVWYLVKPHCKPSCILQGSTLNPSEKPGNELAGCQSGFRTNETELLQTETERGNSGLVVKSVARAGLIVEVLYVICNFNYPCSGKSLLLFSKVNLLTWLTTFWKVWCVYDVWCFVTCLYGNLLKHNLPHWLHIEKYECPVFARVPGENSQLCWVSWQDGQDVVKPRPELFC